MAYPHLLSPGRIGPLTLKNRIVFPAMDQNSCTDDGLITDLNIAHYEARAVGGVGLLILETAAVAYPRGATSRHQPSLSHDGVIPGLQRLADAVHRHGSKMVVQVCHHGKTALLDTVHGRDRLVPSLPLPPTDPMGMVRELTSEELGRMIEMSGGQRPTFTEASTADVAWLIEQFSDAAARVQAAGLDGVELHAAHGYIVSSFLSTAFNQRTDDYGGSVENRARLLCEIVASIRARCGSAFTILVRLDGQEYGITNGTTPELASATACLVASAGADAIHVSATSSDGTGVGFTDGPLPWQPLQYVELARTIRKALRGAGHDTPVIAVGRISPDDAEQLLTDDAVCDFVSMGRQLLADPAIARRLAEGRPDLIRTCINCFVCVAQNFWDAKPVCAVNAELGHYDEARPIPVTTSKHVVVVGGGPAGLEAARVAASRGHRVTLIEKSKALGGTARFSSLTTPMNAEFVRYLEAEMGERGVGVRLGVRVDAGVLRDLHPDEVVVATGARRDRLCVPGAELDHVLSGDDLRDMLTGDHASSGRGLKLVRRGVLAAARRLGLSHSMDRVGRLSRVWMPIGSHVVVVGGGLVGIELAEFLAARKRTVTVVEEGRDLAKEMAHPRRWRALHEARTHGVIFETGARVVDIAPGSVTIESTAELSGPRRVINADHVVVASGVRPDTTFADHLRAEGYSVHVIGDAGELGYIQGAVRSGYLVGRSL